MYRIYYALILKKLKTIDDVPIIIRDKVQHLLDLENSSICQYSSPTNLTTIKIERNNHPSR